MQEEGRQNRKIPRRMAQAVIGSLKGGVVPRIGLPYITVGRKAEIDALLSDVDIVSEGGASFRFLVGRYGSGKSFLLQTIRNYVMDRNFVVMDADLSPERKLTGTKGQGLATYRELIGNLATRTRPEGGALALVLDRWISGIQTQVMEEALGQTEGQAPEYGPGSAAFDACVRGKIRQAVAAVSGMVHGFDFARLLTLYYEACRQDDDDQKGRVLKWFRGEYPTRTQAREELGVNAVITDDNWYDYLKLFACFFRQAGYMGLMIFLDELVNLYKIPNSIARSNNYEKILTMYNDALQGKAHYMGMILSGTPQCIEDTRRGIYSYEALRSRLQEGKFSREGARDLLSPVIRLRPLTPEEMLVLTEKLTEIHASLYAYRSRVSQEDRVAFIKLEYSRVGADSHITPREIIRDYIELLDLVYQDSDRTPMDLISSSALFREGHTSGENITHAMSGEWTGAGNQVRPGSPGHPAAGGMEVCADNQVWQQNQAGKKGRDEEEYATFTL